MSPLPLLASAEILVRSLEFLQEAGRTNRECVVLWLGERTPTGIRIVEAYKPKQVAEEDFFRLPRESIVALFERIRDRGFIVAAQVHSHPAQAFHSLADDRWAIVRHVDALSLVLPYFAIDTSVSSFLDDAAIFRLSSSNEWCELRRDEVIRYVRGMP